MVQLLHKALFTFKATATYPEEIKWVKFYVQSFSVGSNTGWQMASDGEWCYYDDTTSPYDITYDWSHLQNGSYSITIWAEDKAGNIYINPAYI